MTKRNRVGMTKVVAALRYVTLFLAFIIAGAAHGGHDGWPIDTTSEAVKGVWMDDFAAATNLAFTTKTPMVLFWANAGCEYCEELEKAINSAEFKAWQREHAEYIYNFVYASGGKDLPPNANSGAKVFAQTAGGTKSALTHYPFVCVYWPKWDGTVRLNRYHGLKGSMNAAAANAGKSLAGELAACIESNFAGYVPLPDYIGGDLAFTSTYANARLEAEVGFTQYVDVPLVREPGATAFIATNTIVATCAGMNVLNQTVVWAVGQSARAVRVTIPADAVAGGEIVVTLNDAMGVKRGSVPIFLVAEKPNSTKNPFFIGERTVDALGYGEWTMDLDVAMEKYRKEPESHLMAVASGSLWCPDCVMTDEHVLETAAFKAWAVENKVILVDLDVPNFPNTTNSACLLTRVVGRTSDGYISGRGTLATNELERYQSGAGYLSRHMISDEAAAQVLARNRSLVGRNVLNGGWNNPDRANQNRTGIPNFFALRRDGTLAGSFETFDAIGPSEFKQAYLKRFSELIAQGADESDEFANRSWQTTKDEFSGQGSLGGATLSAIDLVDTYRLAATASAAEMQRIVVRGDDAQAVVTVSILSVVNGTVNTVATATGRLSDGIEVEGVISSAGEYYVKIAGDGTGTLAADAEADSTITVYAMEGSRKTIENPYSNDWVKAAIVTTLPLYASDGITLKGILSLTTTAKGKITAKYSDGKSTLATFSGKWSGDIAADGTTGVELTKKGWTLSLEITADGAISAVVTDGTTTLASPTCELAVDYGAFLGTYSIAFLPVDAAITTDPAGCAFMQLKMASTRTAKKNGAFKFTLTLPDGKSLAGTTHVTWLDANFGIVPVLKKSGDNTFAATLKVRRNAGSAPSARAVIAQAGTKALWTNTTKGRTFSRAFATYGSWYDSKASLLTGIEEASLTLAFKVDASLCADSASWGALVSVSGDGAQITVTDKKMTARKTSGFTFSASRSSGKFSGTTYLEFEGKSKVTAKFSGVLLRGWFSDCDCGEDNDPLIEMENVAFGLGYLLFTDKNGKKTVKRSIPVAIGSVK